MSNRKNVLDAAESLIRESGTGFSMDDLAHKAGISRATLYRIIPSRKALFNLLSVERNIDTGNSEQCTRERILNSAVEVFGEYGLEGATIEQIAETAKVTPMTVYRQFGDKIGLIQRITEERGVRKDARMLASNPGEDMEKELISFARQGLRALAKNSQLFHMAISASARWQKLLGKIRDEPNGSTAMFEAYFQKQIDSGRLPAQNSRQLAVAFTGLLLIFGYFAPRFQHEPLTDSDSAAQFIVRLFLHGISVDLSTPEE